VRSGSGGEKMLSQAENPDGAQIKVGVGELDREHFVMPSLTAASKG
jgi:hypothetical protein